MIDGMLVVTDEIEALSGGAIEVDVLANDFHPEGYSFELLDVGDGVSGRTWIGRGGEVMYKV